MTSWPWLLHLAATLALFGVIWVVQLAVYPRFDAINPARFPDFHARYSRGIGAVVGPLMLAEAASGAWLLAQGPQPPAFVAAAVLLAVTWVSTAAVQVPLHAQLARGFDPAAHRRLVRTNWVRTAAWTLRAALLLRLAAG